MGQDPNLQQDEQKLAGDLGAQAARAAVFFGKAKAAPFIAAVQAGANSLPANASATVKQIVDQVLTLLVLFATIYGKLPFSRLVATVKYLYDDVTTGKVQLLQIFRAFEQAKGYVAQMQAGAAVDNTDPNLSTDQLKLATGFGVLAQLISLYLGGTKAAPFITAFLAGIESIDLTVDVTEQEVVDGFFGVAGDVGAIINNSIFTMCIATGESIYDEFAGGKVSLIALYTHFEKAKAAIQAPAPKAA